MTKKKFRKKLMSIGYSRNEALAIANLCAYRKSVMMRCGNNSYFFMYYSNQFAIHHCKKVYEKIIQRTFKPVWSNNERGNL